MPSLLDAQELSELAGVPVHSNTTLDDLRGTRVPQALLDLAEEAAENGVGSERVREAEERVEELEERVDELHGDFDELARVVRQYLAAQTELEKARLILRMEELA